jgi:hypothetical protein
MNGFLVTYKTLSGEEANKHFDRHGDATAFATVHSCNWSSYSIWKCLGTETRGVGELVELTLPQCTSEPVCGCGATEGLTYGPDPYDSEINDNYTDVWLCQSCIKGSSDEI